MVNIPIHVIVNGTDHKREVAPNQPLLDFLRDDLGLTGAKSGCGQGICGCCTVTVDGEPIKACLMLAVQADGCHLGTVEGLERNGDLHPVQAAFMECGAVQCGFCIPGMVVTAAALLDANPCPDEQQIRMALANNLCRCTGYVKLVEAVKVAARAMSHD